jgi:Uma2 family endonuclease
MDTVLDQPWTVERFLAWEDRQERKHEFDGKRVIPMTGGSIAHQEIVFAIRLILGQLLAGRPFRAIQEMRLRGGAWVRYPDVLVFAGPIDQTTKTLTDAIAIFEVTSAETGIIDHMHKLRDYTVLPSLRSYVVLEQTCIGAMLYQREPGGPWIASAHTDGVLALPGLDVELPLAALYDALSFPA